MAKDILEMAGDRDAARPTDLIQVFIAEKGWTADHDAESHRFSLDIDRETHRETYYFALFNSESEFAFYIVPDFTLPQELHSDVAEYVNRVNLGLRIGNFEFDYAEGKIRFKSSLRFSGASLTLPLIRGAVEPALTAWNAYLPGAVKVIAGEATPQRALNQIDYGT